MVFLWRNRIFPALGMWIICAWGVAVVRFVGVVVAVGGVNILD